MTVISKGIRVRFYTTEEQETLLNKTSGCCRFVYSKTLEDCKWESRLKKGEARHVRREELEN